MKFHTIFTWKKPNKNINPKEIYFNNRIDEVLDIMMKDLSDDNVSSELHRQITFDCEGPFFITHRYRQSLKIIKKLFIENQHNLNIEQIGLIFDDTGVTKKLVKIIEEPPFGISRFNSFKDIILDESRSSLSDQS